MRTSADMPTSIHEFREPDEPLRPGKPPEKLPEKAGRSDEPPSVREGRCSGLSPSEDGDVAPLPSPLGGVVEIKAAYEVLPVDGVRVGLHEGAQALAHRQQVKVVYLVLPFVAVFHAYHLVAGIIASRFRETANCF